MNLEGLEIEIKNEDKFIGRYKDYDIEIDRECEDSFYIVVVAPCGMSDYDGYWIHNKYDVTMNDAIEEAINGAMIS